MLSGIVIDLRLEQLENAELPIDVTLSPIVTDVRLLHSLNALKPIDVTLSLL